MMSITRTASLIEIALDESRRIAFDTSAIKCAMLTADRLPCGRVVHAVLLAQAAGEAPLRIDGSLAELGVIHQYVMESMMDGGRADCMEGTCH